MKFSKGELAVWVLIPTISLDFHFKQIALTWLKWSYEVCFRKS